MQQHGDVVGLRLVDEAPDEIGLARQPLAALRDQCIERHQTGQVVGIEPTLVIVEDGGDAAGRVAQLQQLVDLLLILGDADGRRAMAGRDDQLLERNVRKDRRREGAQHVGGEHGVIEPRAVVADHGHRGAGDQAGLLEPRRHRGDLREDLAPVLLLPDAVAPLTEGDAIAELGGIAGERRDQRRRLAIGRDRPMGALPDLAERRHAALPV